MIAKTIVICAFIAATIAAPADEVPRDFFETPDGLIINGKKAEVGQFPHQAWLQIYLPSGGRRGCGGSLINEKWILTAAHCTDGGDYAEAIFGTVDKTDCSKSPCKKVISNHLITHENYISSTIRNDIALIELDEAIELNANISTIKVAKNVPRNGQTVYPSGYGSTTDLHQSASDVMYWVDNPVEEIIKDGEVIMIDTTGEKGVCSGDSGGPLNSLNDMRDGDGEVYGIASYVTGGGCRVGSHGFVNVVHYLDWIEENSGLSMEQLTLNK